MDSIQVDDVESCAESHIPDGHDDEEAGDSLDCLLVQRDEERSRVKQAQPIEHLHPQADRGNGGKHALNVDRHEAIRVCGQYDEVEDEVEQIVDVPVDGEVLLNRLCVHNLRVFAHDLIYHEHVAEAESGIVDRVVESEVIIHSIVDQIFVIEGKAHEVDDAEEIHHERHELRLENLLLVQLPVRHEETIHKVGLQDALIARAVQDFDEAQELSLIWDSRDPA